MFNHVFILLHQLFFADLIYLIATLDSKFLCFACFHQSEDKESKEESEKENEDE
jgi:hypothetical protein